MVIDVYPLALYILTSTCLGFLEYKFFRSKWMDEAKAKAGGDGTPKPPSDVAPRKLASGRSKTIGERAEAWVKQRIDQASRGNGPGKDKRR